MAICYSSSRNMLLIYAQFINEKPPTSNAANRSAFHGEDGFERGLKVAGY